LSQLLHQAAAAKPPVSRLFLVGCQRSGTTVLQAAAGRLPGLLTMPETHWFPNLLGACDEWVQGQESFVRDKWRRRLALASPRTYRKLRGELGFLDRLGAPRLRRRLRGSGYIHELVRILDTAARQQGCSGWLEKTPDHFVYIDVIRRYIPDARFVHLIRNCEDVIASAVDGQMRYADRDGFHGSIAFWVQRWNRAAETHLRFAGAPNHLVLCYEDFVAAPQEQLERLRRFAGLAAGDSAPRQPYIADLEREPWKDASVNQPVRPPERKFEQLFGPRLQAWLRGQLHDYAGVCAELRRRQSPRSSAGEQARELRQAVGAEESFFVPEPVR
jgi:hypothetical protein